MKQNTDTLWVVLTGGTISSVAYLLGGLDKLVIALNKISSLPPRLNRYKKLGRERFKKEIVENLQIGNILTDQKGSVAIWNSYNLTFMFDDKV